jgi:hypothetical protein
MTYSISETSRSKYIYITDEGDRYAITLPDKWANKLTHWDAELYGDAPLPPNIRPRVAKLKSVGVSPTRRREIVLPEKNYSMGNFGTISGIDGCDWVVTGVRGESFSRR